MKKVLIVLAVLATLNVLGWGNTGHRAIGHIAEQHLSRKAKKQLKRILGSESLAIASTWMDEVRSDKAYNHTHVWHYVTIPDGQTYETAKKAKGGDVIQSIERIVSELKKGGLDAKIEKEQVKMLIHLVGDIHQPLHVGNGKDRGGNDVKVKYFWKNSNLHRVWDSGIIDGKQLSYTELANMLNHATKQQINKWQNSTVRDWAMESAKLRDACYDTGNKKNINYRYDYKHWPTVKLRLLQAGIRLAGLLNEIYG